MSFRFELVTEAPSTYVNERLYTQAVAEGEDAVLDEPRLIEREGLQRTE